MTEYRRKPNVKCSICNKSVYRRPGVLKLNKGKAFCSQKCYGLSCRKEVPCKICKKPILSSQNKKTCSRACANKNRAGIRYRKNRPHDKVYEIRAIKQRLFRTRGAKCERCLYDIKYTLQVHHKNRNNKDNRFENLEILCPNCHAEEHYKK